MTIPAQPSGSHPGIPNQPPGVVMNKAAPTVVFLRKSWVRAVISLVETGGAVTATVFAGLNNGQDLRHSALAALIAFCAHGINHNAGGSPV